MVFAVGAASSFVGALAAERVTRRLGAARTMLVGLLLYAASTALIPVIPGFGLLGWLLMIGHQLGDAGEVAYAVNHVSLIQATVPGERLGRVTGAFEFAGVVAMLVGTAIGGLLGEVLGLRSALVGATAFATLAALSLLRLPAARAAESLR
jgi:MFS family permease